jgi:hypothetical protein
MGRYELEPGMDHDSPTGGRTAPALVASTADLMQTIIATARNAAVAVKLMCLRMCPLSAGCDYTRICCALNDDVGRAYQCADQRKSRSIKHKCLPVADKNVLAVIRLRDPQNAAQGLHAQSLTVANVEHFARLEVCRGVAVSSPDMHISSSGTLRRAFTGQKNASARISMLSRGRATDGELGSSNAVWAVQRARPSLSDS